MSITSLTQMLGLILMDMDLVLEHSNQTASRPAVIWAISLKNFFFFFFGLNLVFTSLGLTRGNLVISSRKQDQQRIIWSLAVTKICFSVFTFHLQLWKPPCAALIQTDSNLISSITLAAPEGCLPPFEVLKSTPWSKFWKNSIYIG